MPMTATTNATPRAWTVLFTSLCLSAGHGIALFFVITRIRLIPSIHDMGDKQAAACVGWFLISVPLCALALLLRGRLQGLASGKLNLLAALALVLTVVAYGGYFFVIARG